MAATIAMTGKCEWNSSTSIGIEGSALDHLRLAIPLLGPMQAAIGACTLGSITIPVTEIEPSPAPTGDNPQRPILDAFGNSLSPIFVEYYETHRSWLEERGMKISDWPTSIAFGRVIRNAMSHGNKIKMTDKKQKPVNWRSLKYDISDHDKAVYGVGCDLFILEVILLMFDMSKELDDLGCPIEP